MKKQKDAVVEEIKNILGTRFTPFKDNVLLVMKNDELEQLKHRIAEGITVGTIDYSKDRANYAEVRVYSRSMVMNHIKKAKEINGNREYQVIEGGSRVVSNKIQPPSINMDILPEYLKDYLNSF